MLVREAGQYFLYIDEWSKDQDTFVQYDWIRSVEGSANYFVVIEKRELSFYKKFKIASQKKRHNTSILYEIMEDQDLIFKIDFSNVSLSYPKFNELFLDDTVRILILDFFWDLYFSQCFTHSKNHKELKLLFDTDPYFTGVVSKLFFYELVMGYCPYETKADRSGNQHRSQLNISESSLGLTLLKEVKQAQYYFWKYLLKEEHEVFFRYGKDGQSTFFGLEKRRNLWFDSLEDELKVVLSASQRAPIKIEQQEDFIKKSAKLLIKRYSILGALQYILPKKIGLSVKNVFLAICIAIILSMSAYYAAMNIFVISDPIPVDILYYLIVLFVLIFPMFHLFLAFSLGKEKSKIRWKALFPQIYLPRLFIALCSGWLIFLTAEETTKYFDVSGPDENKVISILLTSLGGMMLVLMYNEIKSTAPSESPYKLVKRAMSIFALGLIMSFSIGYVLGTEIFNNLAKENKDLMMQSSQDTIVKYQDSISNIEKTVDRMNYYKGKIDRFKLDPEYLASIESKSKDFGVNAFFSYSGTSTSQINVNELLTNIQKQTKQFKSISDSLKILTLKDSELSHYLDTLSSDFLLKSLPIFISNRRLALEHTDSLIDVRKNDILALKSKLNQLTDEKTLETNHFNNYKKYIKVHQITSDEPNYIPFNQILNRAIVALFIGVFLQLVIQDKTITEPI